MNINGYSPSQYQIARASDRRLQDSLDRAAKAGDTDSIKRLLRSQGSAINLNRPLQLATEFGHVDAVELLLEGGADVSINHCAILLAIERGHYNIVQLLLKHGASAIAFLNMPMNTAARKGNVAIMALLKEAGAFGPSFLDNQTFRIAAESGKDNVMRELLSDPEENITDRHCLVALKNKKIEVLCGPVKLALKDILDDTVKSLKSCSIRSLRLRLLNTTGSTTVSVATAEQLGISKGIMAMINEAPAPLYKLLL